MSAHNVFLARRQAKASGGISLRMVAGVPLLASGAALMVGLLASGAQAQTQCGSGVTALLPFGQGGGLNAFMSVINTVDTAFLTNTTAFVSAPGGAQPDEFGSGVWARAIGGTVETKAIGTVNASVTVPWQAQPITGSGSCPTKVRVDYGGFQAGHDIAVLNDSTFGGNWHFGVTGGYVGAKAQQEGGTLAGNFEVPFVGLYGMFTKGNFLADAQVRGDFFQSALNDPVTNGIFNQRLDARAITFSANAAYRFDLSNNWFIEPSVGGVLSRVSVDPYDISGTAVLGNVSGSLPGRVQINDFDSDLGRASMRVGTTVKSGDGLVVAQPYFTASVFHEFAGDVTSSLSANPAYLKDGYGASGTFNTSRVGTYAQFGVGSAFQWVNTGWLAYIRGDYRTGENIEGWGVNAGLRYQLGAETAGLKDGGSLKDSPLSAAYNWTGTYLGGSFGSTWGTESWRSVTYGTTTNPDFAGELFGGQVGYNYQVGHIVTGVEADLGFTNARGAKSCPSANAGSCQADMDLLASLGGRLGYAWGRTLLYAKGGLAFGDVTASGHSNTGTAGVGASTTLWGNGWTFGGGFEVFLADHWSAKAEYMHYDLGKDRYTIDSSGAGQVDATTVGDTVRVGMNYHLDNLKEAEPLK
jgi:opacity protein-like surface antigen